MQPNKRSRQTIDFIYEAIADEEKRAARRELCKKIMDHYGSNLLRAAESTRKARTGEMLPCMQTSGHRVAFCYRGRPGFRCQQPLKSVENDLLLKTHRENFLSQKSAPWGVASVSTFHGVVRVDAPGFQTFGFPPHRHAIQVAQPSGEGTYRRKDGVFEMSLIGTKHWNNV